MNNVDMYFELSALKKEIKELRETCHEIRSTVKPDADLWDNADIMRYWKVSQRTLASWRANGLIGFIQVGSKIWYPREARELFLSRNSNQAK